MNRLRPLLTGLIVGCCVATAGLSEGRDSDGDVLSVTDPYYKYRDSDGNVISVILPDDWVHRDSDGNVISITQWDYFIFGRTDLVYLVVDNEIDTAFVFTPEPGPLEGTALPTKISVDGTTYAVETDGGDVFLHPEGRAVRLATQQISASARRVNPTKFGLD